MKPKHVTIIADNLEEAIQEALYELRREYEGESSDFIFQLQTIRKIDLGQYEYSFYVHLA